MKSRNLVIAFSVALLIAAIFVLLTSNELTRQGPYYDELFQAPASFHYVGKNPSLFALVKFHGFPVLNMSYIGAIKSNIYGLYMRICHKMFTINSWRMTGILFVAIGFGLFAFLLLRRGKTWTALICVLFMFSDASLLLMVRHDHGPAAIALLLRILFIGIYLSHDDDREIGSGTFFLIGAILGLSVFEKLSSMVLAAPLLVMLAMDVRFRKPRPFFSILAGGLVGGSPLILVNLATYFHSKTLVSLSSAIDPAMTAKSLPGLLVFLKDYLSCGNGGLSAKFILGTDTMIKSGLEMLLISSLLLGTMISSIRFRRTQTSFRSSRIMCLSYFGMGVFIYLLPRQTWVHHWILGTPFQYAAIALSLAGLCSVRNLSRLWLIFRVGFIILTILFLCARAINVIGIERDLQEGNASLTWDPSLASLGRFAAAKGPETFFIVTSWGYATSMYCLTGGNDSNMAEVFWRYHNKRQLKRFLSPQHITNIYLITGKASNPKWPDMKYFVRNDSLLKDFRTLPDWEEIKPDIRANDYRLCDIYEFRRKQ